MAERLICPVVNVDSGAGGGRRRRHASVTTGLRTTMAFFLVALALAGIAGVSSLLVATEQLKTVIDRYGPLDQAGSALLARAGAAETHVRAYVSSGDSASRRAYIRERQAFDEALDRARRLAADEGEIEALIDEQGVAFDLWAREIAAPAADARATQTVGANQTLNSERAAELTGQLAAANAEADNLIGARRDDARERVAALAQNLLILVVGVVLLGLIAGWHRARRMRAGLIAPLHRLRETVARLESGDLDARAGTDGLDEVRAVAEAVNALANENRRLTLRQAQRLEQERLVRRLAANMHEHLDVLRILSLAGAAVGETLRVDRVIFQLSTPDGFGPVVLEWRAPGVEPLGDVGDKPVSRGHPLLERILESGVVTYADVHADPWFRPTSQERLARLDIRAGMSAPIYAGDLVVALMTAHVLGRPRDWLPSEIDLVRAIASELGAALRHAQLYEAERDMVHRLRELDEVKSDFASSISHELRSPLTSITGYVEMLRDHEAGPLTSEQDHMLGVVQRNTDRLLVLIEDLLTLARVESRVFKLTAGPVDIASIVDGALQAMRPQFAERAIRLSVDVPPGLAPVVGDAYQLERILVNLLSNAAKFTPPGGTVRLSLSSRYTAVVIEVADTGIGIPLDEQEQVFTRFFRSSTSQRLAIPGTGLGLAIVRTLTEAHGGHVDIRSEPDRGTVVTVTLPVAAATPLVAEQVAT